MKIAITSSGPNLDSPVDERFGRTRYVLFVDPDSGSVEAYDNSVNMNAAQGAGIQVAQLVADKKAAWVLTGHVGPKAFQALEAAGIKVGTGVSGTCRRALENFKAGTLRSTGAPDVKSHWGQKE